MGQVHTLDQTPGDRLRWKEHQQRRGVMAFGKSLSGVVDGRIDRR
jgi:hypothetical protein